MMVSRTSCINDNYILEYYNKIKNGEVTVSEKVRKVYIHLAEKLLNNKEPDFYYDHNRAMHVITFIERYCKHSKGKLGGKPFILELWQKAMLSAMFGFVDADGKRQYREVLFIVARKNGKSALSSAVGLYLMIFDSEPGSEVYSCATKKDQAKIIWTESVKMVRKSPSLAKRIKCRVADMYAEINESVFKALASDSGTLDGLNVHGALMDEIHAWKDKNLYDVVVDGTTAREQPMVFITTTAGTVREAVFDLKYDEASKIIDNLFNDDEDAYKDYRVLPIIYELDDKDEWMKPECWAKANPGLGTIKSVDQLADKVNRAKDNELLVSNLLTKDFNVPQNPTESWLSFDIVNNKLTYNMDEHREVYCFGGVDLSATTDLTCATLLWKRENCEEIFVLQHYFIPEDIVATKILEDKVPYDVYNKQGLITFTPGSRVDFSLVTEWFVKMRDEYELLPLSIGYDTWGSQYWADEMKRNGFKLDPVIQGAKTMSQPMKEIVGLFKEKKINYNNNTLTKWCLTNTQIKTDENGNIRPVKGQNSKQRIDGSVSLIDAYVVYSRNYEDYHNLL